MQLKLYQECKQKIKIIKSKKYTLSEGSYGNVYKVQHITTQQIYALKKIKMIRDELGIPQSSIREIGILRILDHPNIIFLQDLYFDHDKNQLFLLFEFIQQDLKKFISSKQYTINIIKQIFIQIVKGINYCHQMSVFHRDLKPQNILINDQYDIKIADFGLSRKFSIPFQKYSSEIVTLWYRSPEVLLGCKSYGIGVDLWCLGLILYELYTSEPLFAGNSQLDTLIKIFQLLGTPSLNELGNIEDYPQYEFKFPKFKQNRLKEFLNYKIADSLAVDLICNILVMNQYKRYTCKQILMHSYLKLNQLFRFIILLFSNYIIIIIICKYSFYFFILKSSMQQWLFRK